MMKKKRLSTSSAQPSIKNKRQREKDADLVHDFFETLSDKADDVHSFIKDSDSLSMPSLDIEDLENFINNISDDTSQFRNLKGFTSFQWAENLASSGAASYLDGAEEESYHYRYLFTDSEFLAFVAALDPYEYLIITNLISILIASSYNLKELEVIYNFFNNLSDILQIIVDQELFMQGVKEDEENAAKKKELHDDLILLHQQIEELQQHVKTLETIIQD